MINDININAQYRYKCKMAEGWYICIVVLLLVH